MKLALYIIGVIFIMVLFQLQDKLRKPKFNRMHNVWNEDKEAIFIANAITVTMLIMAFILGLTM
jgi:hypothetical protein